MIECTEYLLNVDLSSGTVYCPYCDKAMRNIGGPNVPRGAVKCYLTSCEGYKIPYFQVRAVAVANMKEVSDASRIREDAGQVQKRGPGRPRGKKKSRPNLELAT